MPVIVKIFVNDRYIKEIRIGRAYGGVDPDDINRYIVTRDGLFWDGDNAVQFDHRYGDGIEKCVALGMSALVDLDPDANL